MDLLSLPFQRVNINSDNYDPAVVYSYYVEYCCEKWGFVSVENVLVDLESNFGFDNYVECFYKLLKGLGRVKVRWSGNLHVVNGVPGSGKTTSVLGLPKTETVVVVPFSGLREMYRRRGFLSYTIHSAVSSIPKRKILVFDEITCLCEFLVLSIILIVQPVSVFLVGDLQQCWLLDSEGKSIKEFLDSIPVSVFLNVNRRNPCPDVNLLRRVSGIDVRCRCGTVCCSCENCSGVCLPMTYCLLGDGMSLDDDVVVICFSHKTRDYLNSIGFTALTVRSAMGSEFAKVALFYIDRFDRSLIRVNELKYVGLSRHTVSLTVCSDLSEDTMRHMLHNSNLSQYLNDELYTETTDDYDYTFGFAGALDEVFGYLGL